MRISTNQIYARGTTNMISQQERLMKLQEQLATGIRVNSPSDDPIASAQIELINQRTNSVQIYQKNNQDVTSALNLQESIMTSIITNIQTLQSLQVQSGNSALSKADREALATEAEKILDGLVAFANSTGSSGDYIFAGSRTSTPPITRSASSTLGYTYNYVGDNKQRFQAISDSLQVAINDPGSTLFMDIAAGNGTFGIKQTANPNNGAISVSGGVVTNASLVPANETFTITTQANNTVTVVDSANNPVTGSPFAYQSGEAISFRGMSITLSGTMAANQTFSLTTGSDESIFATVQRMVNNLKAPYDSAADKAKIQTENIQIGSQLTNALDNISNQRANLGSKLNQLESIGTANSSIDLLNKEVLNQLKAADYVSVAGEYNMQIVSLQAAQQSFVRIQSLSVFSYLT